MNQRLSLQCFALTLLVTCLVLGGGATAGASPKPAPDFTLECLSGDRVSLEQHRGRVILIDFFATWCLPCCQTIPRLNELQKKYGAQDLVVLGISLDSLMQLSNADLKAYAEKHKVSYTVLRADNQVIDNYFEDGDIILPTLFLIDRGGRIVSRHTGLEHDVESALQKLLSE